MLLTKNACLPYMHIERHYTIIKHAAAAIPRQLLSLGLASYHLFLFRNISWRVKENDISLYWRAGEYHRRFFNSRHRKFITAITGFPSPHWKLRSRWASRRLLIIIYQTTIITHYCGVVLLDSSYHVRCYIIEGKFIFASIETLSLRHYFICYFEVS